MSLLPLLLLVPAGARPGGNRRLALRVVPPVLPRRRSAGACRPAPSGGVNRTGWALGAGIVPRLGLSTVATLPIGAAALLMRLLNRPETTAD